MSADHPWTVYVKRAFQNWYNYGALILCGGLALILREPGWLLLGGGLELGYLYMMSGNPRFRRHVDSQIMAEQELDIEPLREQLWPHIEESLRQRYRELARLAERLEGETASELRKRDPFYIENKRKVAVLLANYLKIAMAVTRYNSYLSGVDQQGIVANIERLEQEISSADERVQQVKQKNIDVLRKRLDKLVKAKANSEYLIAQMETIEDTMQLVVDQAITLSDPRGMGSQIDNLLLNLQETELIAAEMEPFSELEHGFDEVIELPRERE